MKESRLAPGVSDPVSFTCTCPATNSPKGGVVLLFYRYFASTPPLPLSYHGPASDPSLLAVFHNNLTRELKLGGKIRIAKEGFNVTVGGTSEAIESYIQALISHWSFAGLDLDTPHKQTLFFKPTPGGCACVFGGASASVQTKAEITPMGVTDYSPENWEEVESLGPEEFHERFWERGKERVLIDVRNHYESRIGYFVDPISGKSAVRPGIRRFSQWPGYVKKYFGSVENEEGKGRQFMTYCTGGIRCEKGVRWMQENMAKTEGDTVCTLKGGITAYLMWMDEEIKAGRKRPEDSLFRGRNYVFDARGSTGLNVEAESEPVSKCHLCRSSSHRLVKCRSNGCHLILVICKVCDEIEDPRCCQSCEEADLNLNKPQDLRSGRKGPKPICLCEQEREAKLWGGEQITLSKARKIKGNKAMLENVNIKIKTIV